MTGLDESVQHRWHSDGRKNIYSACKGVCALAIGIPVEDGILPLGATVPELLAKMELGQEERTTPNYATLLALG